MIHARDDARCCNITDAQVLKVMAKKLVRKALEMLRKLATEDSEDEEGEGEVCINLTIHQPIMYIHVVSSVVL